MNMHIFMNTFGNRSIEARVLYYCLKERRLFRIRPQQRPQRELRDPTGQRWSQPQYKANRLNVRYSRYTLQQTQGNIQGAPKTIISYAQYADTVYTRLYNL